VAEINGVPCRVIAGGLTPDIAKAVRAEDFSSKLWICSDYTPRRIDIHRSDFAMSFLIENFTYSPAFPASTWQPPAGGDRCLSLRRGPTRGTPLRRHEFPSDERPGQAVAA